MKARRQSGFWVGEMYIGHRERTPPAGVCAEVLLTGVFVGCIEILAERMPGPESPPNQRRLVASDSYEWNAEELHAGHYEIRWNERA